MRKKAGTGTLSSNLRLIIALVLVMQVALLLINNLYSYKIITENSVQEQMGKAAGNAEQFRYELHSYTDALNELAADYMNDTASYSEKNELKKYFTVMNTAATLNLKMSSHSGLECIFFSSPDNDIYLTRFSPLITWQQRFALDDYVKANRRFANDSIGESWHVVEMLDTDYLMQVYSLDNANIGVFTRLDRFLQEIEKASAQDNDQYVFLGPDGAVLASGGNEILKQGEFVRNGKEVIRDYQGKYFAVIMDLQDAPVSLSVIKNRDDIYPGMNIIQCLLIVFGLLAFLSIAASSVYISKYIVAPLKKLYIATKAVEKGDLDFRIRETPAPVEFSTLIGSFNHMVQEIKALKIAGYEEKLEKQRAELKYLQVQLKPHFYLNAINTISSLSLKNKNKEIRKFIMALSKYLRYLFTDNLSLVTVKDEIDHAVDYIKLQQIKYPNMVFYMVNADGDAADFLLPKLLIQTFIENIFKHAYTGDEMLSVFIDARTVEENGLRYAKITIEDNGEGFDCGYLAGDIHGENERIGIENVKKTLSLIFGRDDLVSLSNREEGGARVAIRIPEKRTEGGEE